MQRFNDSTIHKSGLQIGVTGREHRGETRDFFLATAPFARLFKMPMSAHDFKRALAVDFFLQPPQRPIHRFAFFQSYFSQRNSLPFQRNLAFREFKWARSLAFPRRLSMRKS